MKSILTTALLVSLLNISFAQQTYIPDDGFEQALIFEGLDTVLDDSIATSTIDTLTFLNLEPFGIIDLTGIEDFEALEVFICRNNDIQQVDLSNNTNITFVNCENNNITSIDVTNCPNLTEIRGENNNLTTIDLTQNPLLEALELNQNGLGTINLDNNTALKTLLLVNTTLNSIDLSNCDLMEILDLSTNQLTSLNVANMSNLETLILLNNSIAQLDLSNNSNLDVLFAASNNLTTLDLFNNPLLTYITCMNNNLASLTLPPASSVATANLGTINNPNLYCISSDDPSYIQTNWNYSIDSFTVISDLCDASVIELETTIQLFPNPSEDGWITLVSEYAGNYQLLDLAGATIKVGEIKSASNLLDFSDLTPGMFILKLELNHQVLTRKIDIL